MRWPRIAHLAAAAALATLAPGVRPAAAKPVPVADDGGLWRDMVEPHASVVRAIVARARRAIGKAAALAPDGDSAIERRQRYLGDAYGMLRHARALAPENLEVLRLLGTTADELGKTREALDALTACVRLAGADHAGDEIAGRLGMIYLRLGQLDDAVRWLGRAQGVLTAGDHATAAVHLATALAARGEMAAAIDVLANALPAQIAYFSDALTLVNFALAVHYDRDDQPGAAFDALDRMQGVLQHEMAPFTQRVLAGFPFAPAEDQYYYLAMLYEAIGDDIEARAEWALYAAMTDAPWRRRALDHIQAIDAQRRSGPPGHRAAAAPATAPHQPPAPGPVP